MDKTSKELMQQSIDMGTAGGSPTTAQLSHLLDSLRTTFQLSDQELKSNFYTVLQPTNKYVLVLRESGKA